MSKQPNVLLVTVDQWPASIVRDALALTPTLDQLARNGTQYSRAYSSCPLCVPARRSLMTGLSPRSHGDRDLQETLPMPRRPTIAQTFRDAGYQAYAVGKLHVYPQRDRIGFDEALIAEEGRRQFGVVDDYEAFLESSGHGGEQFLHGLGNNEYITRSWHLPEAAHVTNWTAREMARAIKRRDPTRPALWYLSFTHPHPPLAPLEAYLRLYSGIEVPGPVVGDWAGTALAEIAALRLRRVNAAMYDERSIALARRAFLALCTQIDYQLRVVLGTLNEEGLLDGTVILFTSDHGDMLGNNGLWGKRLFYEDSSHVPMIVVGTKGAERPTGQPVDDRLVCLEDVMPTLLEFAGLDVPEGVDGLSMIGKATRNHLYGEIHEGNLATRMIHDGRYKLIYYPVGNHLQLFDLIEDPRELCDLADNAEYAADRTRLEGLLISELYGADEALVREGELVGLADDPKPLGPNRNLSGQRGLH